MIYITGDTHGDFRPIKNFCKSHNTSKEEDIMICLGDAGINYTLSEDDFYIKNYISSIPITFFCIAGNHEERPFNIPSYKQMVYHNGIVYYEPEFPNILFAMDGEIYDFNNLSCIVIGGAYSVDKYYRLANRLRWFECEQPSEDAKFKTDIALTKIKNKIDVFLTHTCPSKFIPKHAFLPGIDQSTVDHSTEDFLDYLENKNEYKHWFCGHWHINEKNEKIHFLYHDIIEFPEGVCE